MRAFVATARVVGFVLGGAAIVWGCLLAGFAGQPVPLIGAGVLLIVIAWVGSGWEEIAAKFGDSEVRVKRAAVAAVSEGARAVEKVAATVAKSESLTAAERETIRSVASSAQLKLMKLLLTAPGLTAKKNQAGGPDAEARITVGQPDSSGRRAVEVVGTEGSGDWTVEWRIKLEARGITKSLVVGDGTYIYPDAWGIEEAPRQAKLIFGSGTIYDRDDGFEFINQTETVNW